MLFGNDALKKLDNTKIVIEVEVEISEELVVPINESTNCENIEDSIKSLLEDYRANIKIDNFRILINDKHTATRGGSGDSAMNHSARIKILEPKECKGMVIEIGPEKGSAKLLESDPRSKDKKLVKKVKPALDLANKYCDKLNTIWQNNDKEDLQVKLGNKVIKSEKDHVKEYKINTSKGDITYDGHVRSDKRNSKQS